MATRRTNAARMLLELTDLERELERLLGSNMPGHGAPKEEEAEDAPDDEEPDEQDPA